jgi:hypothetical protein
MIESKYSGVNSEIWSLGNRWDPADISPFSYKIEPPFKFSLKELAKARQSRQPTEEVIAVPEPAFSLRQFIKKQEPEAIIES